MTSDDTTGLDTFQSVPGNFGLAGVLSDLILILAHSCLVYRKSGQRLSCIKNCLADCADSFVDLFLRIILEFCLSDACSVNIRLYIFSWFHGISSLFYDVE